MVGYCCVEHSAYGIPGLVYRLYEYIPQPTHCLVQFSISSCIAVNERECERKLHLAPTPGPCEMRVAYKTSRSWKLLTRRQSRRQTARAVTPNRDPFVHQQPRIGRPRALPLSARSRKARGPQSFRFSAQPPPNSQNPESSFVMGGARTSRSLFEAPSGLRQAQR